MSIKTIFLNRCLECCHMSNKDSNNNPMCDTIIPNVQLKEQPFILNRYVRAYDVNKHTPLWICFNSTDDVNTIIQNGCLGFTKFKNY